MARKVFHTSLCVRKFSFNQLFTIISRIISGGAQYSVNVINLHICAKWKLSEKIMFKIMFKTKQRK